MTTDWVSHVSGPIPNHRIYGERNDVYPQKKVNKLNIEGKGYIGSFSNRTISPKDHLRENVKRMREIQRASRLRQEESRQQRGPFKSTSRPVSCLSTSRCIPEQNTRDNSSTFNNHSADSVSSYTDNFDKRIRSSSARSASRTEISRSGMTSPVVTNRDYLRAHEKTGPPLDLNTYPAPHLRKEVHDAKISVPRASTAREVQLIRRDVDFVRANAYAASSARLRRSPSADSLLINKNQEDEKRKQYKRGETPSYLVRRKKQLEEDEQLALANRPDPDQPKGHRKLSEKERKDTLGLLKSTEKDMLTELGRLPIRTDTLKLRTMKQEIERKISEIEEAIKIFSKPKVFVRIDT